jgi:peptidoglycan/xylan/chitin deacetylase (PgdA/CDA1 family)
MDSSSPVCPDLQMRRKLKLATLDWMRKAGVFDRVANSRWRRERLLILCYHGVSLEDEHLWRPALYIEQALLKRRLETLRDMQCSVLPLAEALTRLRLRDLPPRSVAITFDDGTYDFYKQAYPLLKQYGFPVTVYQTTYYTDHEFPVFNLMCSYLLWKRRAEKLLDASELGLSESIVESKGEPKDLRTEVARHRVVRALIDLAERENLNGGQKNELARRLAVILRVDYSEQLAKRTLQLMNQRELAEVATNGVDVQLHTHRHRTPEEEHLFRQEIRDNRERIRALTGKEAAHFCYPGGIYRKQFVGWLQEEGIVSATTCDAALVTRDDNPYLLPRVVDTSGRSQPEFESWLCGAGAMLSMRRTAPQHYIVPKDRED